MLDSLSSSCWLNFSAQMHLPTMKRGLQLHNYQIKQLLPQFSKLLLVIHQILLKWFQYLLWGSVAIQFLRHHLEITNESDLQNFVFYKFNMFRNFEVYSWNLPIFSSSISSRADELKRNCSFFKISLTIAVNASRYLDKTTAHSSTDLVLANVPDTKSTHVHLRIEIL